ncbi:MAG: hypothetical protein MUE97_01165 [Phycisphaerales bacterium]|jgi:hypothetical protein|nr:hypothetical protein [Phycisphaerales bacterium]
MNRTKTVNPTGHVASPGSPASSVRAERASSVGTSVDGEALFDFSGGPHADPAVWLPRMHKLVGDQTLLAKRLHGYAETLARSVSEGEDAQLGGILDQREAVIREMTLLGEDLRPMLERFNTLATALKTVEEETIRQRVVELDALLVQVQKLDDQARVELEARRMELARELAGVQTARSAASVYQRGPEVAPQASDMEA